MFTPAGGERAKNHDTRPRIGETELIPFEDKLLWNTSPCRERRTSSGSPPAEGDASHVPESRSRPEAMDGGGREAMKILEPNTKILAAIL